MKLYDSELNIMAFLWRQKEATAKEIAAEMAKTVGWSKTTTYTVLKKMCGKRGRKAAGAGLSLHTAYQHGAGAGL